MRIPGKDGVGLLCRPWWPLAHPPIWAQTLSWGGVCGLAVPSRSGQWEERRPYSMCLRLTHWFES